MDSPKYSFSLVAIGFGAGAVIVAILVMLGAKITGLTIGGAVVSFPTDIPVPQPTAHPPAVVQQVTRQPGFTVVPPTAVPPPATTLQNSIDRFPVEANKPKNRTKIWVNAGDTIYIEYLDGQWTGEKGKEPLTTGCGFNWDDPFPSHIYPLDPKQNAGAALIGYIGNQPFFVGCKAFNSEAATSGDLYLGMNDCQDCYGDNDGEINVRIAITRK